MALSDISVPLTMYLVPMLKRGRMCEHSSDGAELDQLI